MPGDIRSFFGGKPPPPAPVDPEPKAKKPPQKKGRGSRKVIEDDSEDEAPPPPPKTKKSTPVKPPPRRAPSPEGEATTTSDYFANTKPKRSEPVRAAPPPKPANGNPVKTPVKSRTANGTTTKTDVKTPSKSTPGSTRSTRTRAAKPTPGDLNEDDFPDDLDEEDLEEMAPSQSSKPAAATSRGAAAKSTSAKATPTRATPASSHTKSREAAADVNYAEDEDDEMHDADSEDEFVVPDEDEKPSKSKSTSKSKASTASKRKAKELDDDDEDDLDDAAPKKRTRKASTSKRSKAAEVEDSAAITAIMSEIPTVRAPTPPPRDDDGVLQWKFQGAHKNSQAPAAEGTKERPQGADNCLVGLSFVFTGQLQTIAREDVQELVKRYGGKVTGAPSSKTSFVVLGADAGPSKLEKIRKFGIKTIDEDGLFELIRKVPANGGDSKAAALHAEKQFKDEEKLKAAAEELDKEEKKAAASAAAKNAKSSAPKGRADGPDTRLWTVKYAPTTLSQICGNKAQVDKLQRWLRDHPKNQSTDFKKPGPDGSGTFRAVIIHGPPGIGKTTAAHLVAKTEGYDIVESNASDARSKKLVETGLRGVLDTRSLNGYFAGDGKDVVESKKKLCLIMDEVDGMSAGDRGGVGAMAAVCKKANIPIILICNDRKLPKMKPFDFVTYDLPFRRPTTDMIRARIATIAFREGMKLPAPVLNALIEGTGADIRQVVNMISTAKLDTESMDFNDSKSMSKAWQKHVILKPWDIISKILGGGMFNPASTATLNDKTELYFNDHEFSYLMLQENYLGTQPAKAQGMGNEKMAKLKHLKLASQAADSISDGDLVDRMIHGSQQQWSLMPTHAAFSFVRPAYYVAGNMGYSKSSFTAWLGQNSAYGKFQRYVKEIQGHMRLRTTGDRHEVRQQYVPMLWRELVKRLQDEGKEAIDEIISLMDSYYLTRDDFDAIMELGVGPHKMEKIKIETQDKAAFTREYNKREHPLPFIKASTIGQPKKLSKDKPDLEEAIEESDDGEVLDVKEGNDDEDLDLSKDKYVKQPKKKKAPAAKGKGKKAADDDDEMEDEKPKKARGKAAAKGKAKK